MTSSSKIRIRRSAEEISRLLKDQSEKGYGVRDFCVRHGLSKQTYYNWRQKYAGASGLPGNDFIPLDLPAAKVNEPVPFCEVIVSGSTSIRFYQPVNAKFITSLNLY